MHELSVTESVLDIVTRHANQANARRVKTINLVIGEYASIVDDSVQFYWDIISKDTLAQGAQLQFRRIPAELACLACGQRFQPESETYACPNCGGNRIQIVAGREFFIESIDIEV
jgi:hydrogenase nickel incorporation protein HypA/HybF